MATARAGIGGNPNPLELPKKRNGPGFRPCLRATSFASEGLFSAPAFAPKRCAKVMVLWYCDSVVLWSPSAARPYNMRSNDTFTCSLQRAVADVTPIKCGSTTKLPNCRTTELQNYTTIAFSPPPGTASKHCTTAVAALAKQQQSPKPQRSGIRRGDSCS